VIGWGLVGASGHARQYMVPAFAADPSCRVVAVLSGSPARGAELAAEAGGARVYHELDALLADPEVDAVFISTVNELHAEQTIAAARAGKHVLCEKPLALTLDDARAMRDACAQAGVVLGCNHHLRNAPVHRAIRRALESGAIGRVLAVRVFHAIGLPEERRTWRLDEPGSGGGVVLDITVHDVDLLRFLLDDEVAEVTALTAAQGLGAQDAVMGVLRFRGGVLASHHDAFTVPYAGTGIELHGTDGSIVARNALTQEPVGEAVLRRDGVETPLELGEPESLYARAVRAFNGAIRGEGEPAVSGEDGIRSLAVALAVAESAASGRLVAPAEP
jgi:1,5-anhydro-D-fructose reductase (1,5-anhydro-D-mannitol-forming)